MPHPDRLGHLRARSQRARGLRATVRPSPRCAHPACYARRVPLVELRRNASDRSRELRAFLPTTREEMQARGYRELDVLIVNGDAYVDHPAFGGALIGRFLEARGFRVGMISQPDYQDVGDLLRMGAPRL